MLKVTFCLLKLWYIFFFFACISRTRWIPVLGHLRWESWQTFGNTEINHVQNTRCIHWLLPKLVEMKLQRLSLSVLPMYKLPANPPLAGCRFLLESDKFKSIKEHLQTNIIMITFFFSLFYFLTETIYWHTAFGLFYFFVCTPVIDIDKCITAQWDHTSLNGIQPLSHSDFKFYLSSLFQNAHLLSSVFAYFLGL